MTPSVGMSLSTSQRDAAERDAMQEVGRPVHRVQRPHQAITNAADALLFAEESDLRCLSGQELAHGLFDGVIHLRGHVPVALGRDDARSLGPDDLAGHGHSVFSDGEEGRWSYGFAPLPHLVEQLVEDGKQASAAVLSLITKVGESTPRACGRYGCTTQIKQA